MFASRDPRPRTSQTLALALLASLAGALTPTPAAAQQIRQTSWTSGPGTTSSTSLTGGETGFSQGSGHVLYSVAPGAVRFPQLAYRYAGQSYAVIPVRAAQGAVAYYDRQGFGGTPVYPDPQCRQSHFWLYRNTTSGALAWMHHAGRNGPAWSCAGQIDATYAITPAGVASLSLSDEPGDATLTGFAARSPSRATRSSFATDRPRAGS